MDVSSRYKDILPLGKKIVEELGLDNSTDTLGRWMAHYIADLIVQAEREPAKAKKATAEKVCFEAIAKLWQHHSGFPKGKRPFEHLDSIIETISTLNPENETPRYYVNCYPDHNDTTDSSEQQKWLNKAKILDDSAKTLIKYCLCRAADGEIDKSKSWVKAVSSIENSNNLEIIINFISTEHESNEMSAKNEMLLRAMRDRIDKLQAVSVVVDNLKQIFEGDIQSLSASTK